MTLIAIVDDSRLARAYAAATLSGVGYEVAEVDPTSLSDVLEQLRGLRPALLLLDQLMPAFAGSSLVRACFEDDALSDLKVVMITAQRNDELKGRMAKLGVHAVLYKPISPVDLGTAVAALVGPGSA